MKVYRDPLDIKESSKDPSKSYQWFRFAADRDFSWRDPADTGWTPVIRADMVDEYSDDIAFLQRREMRLFWRPKEETDAAIKEEIDTAQAQIDAVAPKIAYWPDGTPYRIVQRVSVRAAEIPQKEREKISNGLRRFNGAPMLLLFQGCRPKIVFSMASHFQRLLSRMRIVCLSHDEVSVSHLTCATHAEYAFHKMALTREGIISSTKGAGVRFAKRSVQINVYIDSKTFWKLFCDAAAFSGRTRQRLIDDPIKSLVSKFRKKR